MYAKVFQQIFDSSIAENPDVRFTFMDLLVLADVNGVVDMTHEAIARRTNRAIEIIRETIQKLESPDTQSRTPDENGARLRRLDEHRDWGWEIVNYQQFRRLASEEQRRERTKERTRKWRDTKSVTQCDAPKRIGDDSSSPSPSASACQGGVRGGFERPTIEMVKLQGAKIGLPDSESEKFFDYYQSNGWKVGKNAMKFWVNAMANWKRHWQEYGGTKGQSSRPQSLLDLRTIIEAKKVQISELRTRHCSEVAMGDSWNNKEARNKYLQLKAEIKQLNQRIANANA